MECPGAVEGIIEQAERINAIITMLDAGWVRSEKTWEFLHRHCGIGGSTAVPRGDNPEICRMYRDLIEKLGYSVRIAESGAGALSVLAEEQPALVLLDLMMEPMDGWEVLRRMREDERTRDVPVIILTAKALFPEEIIRYGDQLHGFIMKPLRCRDLERVVSGFFAEEAAIAAAARTAREAGVDEATIGEYVALRREVRVLGEMVGCLDRILEVGGSRYKEDVPQLADIRERLTGKKARLNELQKTIEPG